MPEAITVDHIISTIRTWVENREVVDAFTWVDAAEKLNVLQADEDDRLAFLQQKVAQLRVLYYEKEGTIGAAKLRVEASEEYHEYLRQKAKVERIKEFIRLAKVQARLKDAERRLG